MASSSGDGGRSGRASPYPGLSSYDEGDADRFFGRRRERDLVIADLLTSRLTVLYGPSGVGKSSLLRAAVLPRLRRGQGLPSGGSRRTFVVVDGWRENPARAVLDAVAAATGVAPPDGSVPFDEALAVLAERSGGILLLLLDHFEEYFLYHGGDDDPLRSGLPRFLARGDIRTRLLIALREDALAGLDRLDGSTSPLFANLLRLGPLSDESARAAIEKPLDDGPETLEPGLADHVVRLLHEHDPSAGDEGVEPAYLQLVMRRLWERETAAGSSVLRIATLEAMGSMRAIVGDHLREAMERLAPAERRRMAEAVRYLVTPSGAKIAQRRDDLARLTGIPEDDLAAPLEKLSAADARILRPVDEAPTYELFHDVLARPLLDWRGHFESARLQRRAAVLGVLAAAAAAIMLMLAAYALRPSWLEKAELATVDARFALRGTEAPGTDIEIVDLDDAGLAALGGGSDRIPRDTHARMIDALREADAGVIAYDVEFREATPEDDELQAAIERAGPQLLLAATRIDSDGRGEVLGGPGDELSASVGYAGFPIAADGAYRRLDESVGLPSGDSDEPLGDRLESFAVVAAALAGQPAEGFGRAWIDYHGPAGTFPSHRFEEVLEGADPGAFKGKIVVVGTSARLQGDLHATASGGGQIMSGAEIQANAISTLLRGLPLRGVSAAVILALIVLLGLLPAAAALALRARAAFAAVLASAAVALVAAQLAFSAGRVLPVVYPLLALVLSAIGVAVARRAAVIRLR